MALNSLYLGENVVTNMGEKYEQRENSTNKLQINYYLHCNFIIRKKASLPNSVLIILFGEKGKT